ncbi:MAG: methionine synthase [Planctomycetota bacterium]|nr:methionine synthase [Planctomycetota bacterium]
MPSAFLQALARRTLVFDGGMGTQIHKVDLSIELDYCGCENCTDILAKTRPDVIGAIHDRYLEAGADVVETDSFGASKLVLAEFGIAERTYELAKASAEVARASAAKYSTKDKPRFVAGSMGPGTKLITLGNTTWDAMLDSYRECARGLIDGGADLLIIETCQDLLQVKCAINAVLAALEERGKTPSDVPIMASVTIESTGTMLLGSAIEAAAVALAGYPIISLGLNCATGPTEMTEHVHWLGKHWRRAGVGNRNLSVMPNAGLPVLHEGRTEYPLQPQPFVEAMQKFIEADGVNIVGGCCGTTPEHIKLLTQCVEEHERRRHTSVPSTTAANIGGVVPDDAELPEGATSLYSVTDYRQDNSFLIVGERMNASGSRAFKKLLEAEDWDGVVSLAKEQLREGAHVLDLNVDYAGRDNARDMAEIVKRVVRQVDAPLMLDSTQIATIEAGLRHAPGKCIINSANFEDGEEKFDAICKLAKTYGAALVIGSIDEDKQASMARTAERKYSIAKRGLERATQTWGLDAADVLFDPLVLPISTGMETDRRSALELIDGIRRISAAFPRCQSVVGLSNVSFGLNPAARQVLNSAFLHELREAGLTGAIVHASKILPRNKIEQRQWDAAIELIYDRREKGDPLAAFIELFKDATTSSTKRETKDLTIEERLRAHIIDGEKQGLKESIDAALTKYRPLDIINDHLLDGMKTVGELFGSGKMQLPFVLQSAEVMKMSVAMLEPLMDRVQGQAKGTIVLATVKGDVHDIGKNLVDIILTNNGYNVVNIGIKQHLPQIVQAWREHKADAIGLSGLLVKSVNVMEDNIKEMNEQGVNPPLLLGGAALTRHYCEGHLRPLYKGECFYGKDAFEGLATMDKIMAGETKTLAAEIEARQTKRSNAEQTILQSRVAKLAAAQDAGGAATTATTAVRVRSDVAADALVPSVPFWGSRVITDIDLDQVFAFINPVALFRGQWQVKKGSLSDAQYDALLEDTIKPVFERWKSRCKNEHILAPKVVYGYFPCNSDGDDLIVWDPTSLTRPTDGSPAKLTGQERVLERFTFPRQADKKRLCISDFFRARSGGVADVIALHCVTVGHRASEVARQLFEANDYTEYLYLHGLGVETAEALAELWHKRIRQEMGIAGEDSPRIKDLFTQQYRGSRYSFGYPACPDMSDQDKLFRLLDPSRIGCTLTENWQIDPEQSTSAIVVHHPEAKYFNV